MERLDLLGSTFLTDSTNTLNIRSQTDINIEPNSPDVGGSGVGGTVTLGTASHPLTALEIHTASMVIDGAISLTDQATSGTKSLLLEYKSDINGAVDTVADRTLAIDVDGANRNLVLAGDLSITGNSVELVASSATSVILPATGTLASLAGTEVLTNKTIAASSNTITGLTNASIDAAAGIIYSKLLLSSSIVNNDIAVGAAIAYNKLSLGSSIVNADISPSAAISYTKLVLTNSISNGDVAATAAVAYSKLNLTSSVVNADISPTANISRTKLASGTPGAVVVNNGSGILSEVSILSTGAGGTGVSSSATFPASGTILNNNNVVTVSGKSIDGGTNTLSNIPRSSLILTAELTNSDISPSAAISYTKLNLSASIVNSDVSNSAAIAGSKISPDFGNQIVRTTNKLEVAKGGFSTTIEAAGGLTSDTTIVLPIGNGINGQVLQTNGSGQLGWFTASGSGTVTSVDLATPAEFTVSGNPITTAGTITVSKANQAANQIWSGPTTGAAAQPAFRSLVLADLPALTKSDVGLGNVDNTSDVNKPVSTAQGLADTAVQNFSIARANHTGTQAAATITGLAAVATSGLKADVGLGNVDNTSDANKPVSTAQGLADTAVQNFSIARANHTGTQLAATISDLATVATSGLKDDVGLSNVDNTSDATKDAAAVTLTNKTIDGTDNTVQNLDLSSLKTVLGDADMVVLRDASGVVVSSKVVDTNIDAAAAIAVSKLAAGTNTYVLTTTAGVPVWAAPVPTVLSASATWLTADGTTKVVTHSLGTLNVLVQIFDIATGTTLQIDSVTRTDTNTLTLVASQAPGVSWKILILAI